MSTDTKQTERVIHQHLRAFLEGQGVDAILSDYHEDAVFLTPEAVYRGKPAVRAFFVGFLANLPAGAREDFKLRRIEVDGELGYIVWDLNGTVSLGTDTFIVHDGRIAQQTFAMQPS
jgi:ketosteroid isomerase-like protein